MKPRLIILSDLWGFKNQTWILKYTSILEKHYDIKLYDSKILAQIDVNLDNEKEIHRQMIMGGIQHAVDQIIENENNVAAILAFSIGGTIAWKAILNGVQTKQLIAVSSTRLRNETDRPNQSIKLYYGESDFNKPSLDWFELFNIEPIIIKNQSHQLYLDQYCIDLICTQIINEDIESLNP